MAQPFLDLSLIVTRLQAEVSALKRVDVAVDSAAARDDLKNIYPAAYVLPLRERPGPNALANAVSQAVTHTFGVLTAVQSLNDLTGKKARDTLTPIRSDIGDALLNWQPGADYTPCEFSGGRLLGLTDRVMWWLDEYRTRFEVRMT